MVLGLEKVKKTTEKIKIIQEKVKASQSRQKSYHDKGRKTLEFQKGDHVFLRVTPVTGVDCTLKSKKLTQSFIGQFLILHRVGELRKYIPYPSRVIQLDDVQVRVNLKVETLSLRFDDREVKNLRVKEIALVKVMRGAPAGGNATWELESRMRESYP
ncbi:uncharacterized protein LOC127079734 [Lathyrus oleraceus]|uniref:uncharacterized protein LOC127079734 n=1 Tax=Pisum sativum TaxID=3888 RepID=UPI0021CECD27|nr:uncharacterized protein LOC127079734 [Pisum sativum]